MSARAWRQRGVLGAMALTIMWTAMASKGSSPVARPAKHPEPAPAPQRTAPPAQQVARVELERLPRAGEAADTSPVTAHSFGATTWHVAPPPAPPPPVAKPAPPPPPSAPPLPFTFMGRYEEDSTKIIILVRNDRIYTVSEGDVIDQAYRVDRLANGVLELTYLPLNLQQTLNAGGT